MLDYIFESPFNWGVETLFLLIVLVEKGVSPPTYFHCFNALPW
jgi:hypothetical protein